MKTTARTAWELLWSNLWRTFHTLVRFRYNLADNVSVHIPNTAFQFYLHISGCMFQTIETTTLPVVDYYTYTSYYSILYLYSILYIIVIIAGRLIFCRRLNFPIYGILDSVRRDADVARSTMNFLHSNALTLNCVQHVKNPFNIYFREILIANSCKII